MRAVQPYEYQIRFQNGTYLSLVGISLLAAVADIVTHNTIDAIVDMSVALVLTIVRYRIKPERSMAAFIALTDLAFGCTSLAVCIYIMTHGADFNVLFSLLIPIIAFVLYDTKRLVMRLAIYYAVLAATIAWSDRSHADALLLAHPFYLVTFGCAHLYVIAFGWFYKTAIQDAIMRLDESNRIKTLLLQEVHHRVKNNLNLMHALLGLQANESTHRETKQTIESMKDRIALIASVHEALYRASDQTFGETQGYFGMLIDRIQTLYPQRHLAIACTIANYRVPLDWLMQIGIVVSELVSNTLKHNPLTHPRIGVTFERLGDGSVVLTFEETGNRPEQLPEGFGIRMVRTIVEHLEGDCDVAIDPWLRYRIVLPLMESCDDVSSRNRRR